MSSSELNSRVREALNTTQKIDSGLVNEGSNHPIIDQQPSTIEFRQLVEIGKVVSDILPRLRSVVESNQPLNHLSHIFLQSKGHDATYPSILMLGNSSESKFLAFVKPQFGINGNQPGVLNDLELNIMPIPLSLFEKGQHESTDQQLLAMVAAATAAPHFLASLQEGLTTTACHTKKPVVSTIEPSHSVPYSVVFQALTSNQSGLQSHLSKLTNQDPTIGQATHLHGVLPEQARVMSQGVGQSSVASGLPTTIIHRSQLPTLGVHRHLLLFATQQHPLSGQLEALTLEEMMMSSVDFTSVRWAEMAAILGFITQIFPVEKRRNAMENLFSQPDPNQPLSDFTQR